MLRIKNVTIKNFMSIGAITQYLEFNEEELILVLGQNLDSGGNDSRNGVGKSTIINAVSYALFGESIVKIKKDNLINKINKKNMMVTLEFSCNGTDYRIERGRKPNVFKFYDLNSGDDTTETNDAQGENKDTQKDIEEKIGLSLVMFKQIVGLNTFNEPFLSMSVSNQREIIEQLLGITKLSEKADSLKDQIKIYKDAIKEEEYNIKSIEQSNETIKGHIQSIINKSDKWESDKKSKLDDLTSNYESLSSIDITEEINNHIFNQDVKSHNDSISLLDKEIRPIKSILARLTTSRDKVMKKIDACGDSDNCPTCGSEMNKESHDRLLNEYASELESILSDISNNERELNELKQARETLGDPLQFRSTKYKTIDEAKDHENKINRIIDSMEDTMSTNNPYLDQIQELSDSGLQDVDYSVMNELTNYREHQEYLLKLLTNKDSFIRKRIIEQNLVFLNNRLSEYLEKMGLPHSVKFMSDLSVDIDKHGQSFDFDNLSRGEKTRLILSLSWAFRDVYENMNGSINLMFVDELIDNGLDLSGVESALSILKKMAYENKRNVYLISHREELVGRVSGILTVTKQNEFTSLEHNTSGNI